MESTQSLILKSIGQFLIAEERALSKKGKCVEYKEKIEAFLNKVREGSGDFNYVWELLALFEEIPSFQNVQWMIFSIELIDKLIAYNAFTINLNFPAAPIEISQPQTSSTTLGEPENEVTGLIESASDNIEDPQTTLFKLNKKLSSRAMRYVCDCFCSVLIDNQPVVEKMFPFNYYGPSSDYFSSEFMNATPDSQQRFFSRVLKAIITAVLSKECEIHDNILLRSVRTCFDIYLYNSGNAVSIAAKAALNQILNELFIQMKESLANTPDSRVINQPYDAMEESKIVADSDSKRMNLPQVADSHDSKSSLTYEKVLEFETVYVYDAYLIFNALCTMSVLSLNDKVSNPAHEQSLPFNKSNNRVRMKLESKTLSLELIYILLQNFGSVMEKMPHFLTIVSGNLSASLFQNAISEQLDDYLAKTIGLLTDEDRTAYCKTSEKLFGTSVAIFLILFHKFKSHLKLQIEFFIREVLLKIKFDQRNTGSALMMKRNWMKLQTIEELTSDPQVLVDLFVNYDCEMNCDNLFNELINCLSNILQTVSVDNLEEYVNNTAPTINNNSSTLSKSSSISSTINGGSLFFADSKKRTDAVLETKLMNAFRYKAAESTHRLLNSLLIFYNNNNNINSPRSLTMDINTMEKSPTSDILAINSPINEEIEYGESNTYTENPLNDQENEIITNKRYKTLLEKGVAAFNKNPKTGILFLQTNNIISNNTPEAIAHFLHKYKNRNLDKATIGEYLGDHHEFNVKVMHQYIDQLNFKNQSFVTAIRFFLSGFRLPGESQKIDRLMEKFAGKYFEDNIVHPVNNSNLSNETMLEFQPKLEFKNADAAYVLSYSVILLTTDLHNIHVKRKMSKDDFVRNNRGINQGEDLSFEFLSEIYDDIASKGIALNSSQEVQLKTFSHVQQLGGLINKASLSENYYENKNYRFSQFITSNTVKHIHHMYSIVWQPILTSLIMAISFTTQISEAKLCLKSIVLSMELAGILNFQPELQSYLHALIKMTHLLDIFQNFSTKNVAHKFDEITLESITTLVYVAVKQGKYFKTSASWTMVLKSISNLEFLCELMIGHNTDYASQKLNIDKQLKDQLMILKKSAKQQAVSPNEMQSTFLSHMMKVPGITDESKLNLNVLSMSNLNHMNDLTSKQNNARSFLSLSNNKSYDKEETADSDEPIDTQSGSINTQSSISMDTPSQSSLSPDNNSVTYAAQARPTRRKSLAQVSLTFWEKLPVKIDHIFSNSVNFDSETIVCFVDSLVRVSEDELQLIHHSTTYNRRKSSISSSSIVSTPTIDPASKSMFLRKYMLTKIVEISYYNMHRIRLEWSKLYILIGKHISDVGIMDNYQQNTIEIALFAIDSLRQLAMKFLEKGELTYFNFQREFLSPFLYVAEHASSPKIKEFVLHCIFQMVDSRPKMLKSGWKNVFMIFNLIHCEENSEANFIKMRDIIRDHFSLYYDSAFIDALNVLETRACYKNNTISVDSVNAMIDLLNSLEDNGPFNENEKLELYILPAVSSLFRVLVHAELPIRKHTLKKITVILQAHNYLLASLHQLLTV